MAFWQLHWIILTNQKPAALRRKKLLANDNEVRPTCPTTLLDFVNRALVYSLKGKRVTANV
jgi:hypothetical protein